MRLRFAVCCCLGALLLTEAKAQQPASEPLPEIRSLMADVERNSNTADERRKDYTYRVHTENTDLDKAGHPKKTTTVDADSFTIDSVRVHKVTARDGKPLTPEEAKKEDEAVDKAIAKAKERRARAGQKNQPTDSRGDNIVTLGRFFELGTFSNLRASEYGGRPVWLLDFTGDPHAKTRNEFESVIRALTGTLWIDQHDRVLVALEGHFVNDFRIGLGMVANIRKGTTFGARFTRVDDVWLPEEFHGNGSVRFLLLFHFDGQMHETMSNYKKFRTGVTLLPGNTVVGPDDKPAADQPPPASTPAPLPQ